MYQVPPAIVEPVVVVDEVSQSSSMLLQTSVARDLRRRQAIAVGMSATMPEGGSQVSSAVAASP